MKIKFFISTLLIFFSAILIAPSFSFAQTTGGPATCDSVSTIGDIICKIGEILNAVVPALIALGVVYFVWGVVTYMISSDEEAKSTGRNRIIFGIIGLAVIVGMWGLVNIVVNTFDLGSSGIDTSNLVAPPPSGTCSLPGSSYNIQQLLNYFTCIINSSVIPLLFSLAVAIFVWGVVQYVINDSDEAKKDKGRQFILWGVIGLTVMISVWGLVGIVTKTFGINGSIIPQVKSP
jgi:hypothetical protein